MRLQIAYLGAYFGTRDKLPKLDPFLIGTRGKKAETTSPELMDAKFSLFAASVPTISTQELLNMMGSE